MASPETRNSASDLLSFRGDALSTDDRLALQQLAEALWESRHTIAAKWANHLIEILPEFFPSGVSADALTQVNESVLSLVLTQLEHADLDGLYTAYYEMNRRLIEADLERAQAARLSLAGLYTSARVSLRVIEEHLGDTNQRMVLAYSKLTAQLMMLVGRAYSDAREAYLQRVFEQINTLSHELHAPLSHLFGYLELLRAGEFGSVSAEQDQVLGQLIRESDELLLLLTGTLDLSRLDTGRVDVYVEEFSLDEVFTDVINATPHPNVSVTTTLPPDLPLLRTDRVKVKQIVGNLLRNAIRHGAGSPVELTAAVTSGDHIEISVADRGPGIAPEDAQVIFDFFERGHAAGLARDGYGIGLHVVRRLVTMLGGHIDVHSDPPHGACFRVGLPLHHSTPPPPQLA